MIDLINNINNNFNNQHLYQPFDNIQKENKNVEEKDIVNNNSKNDKLTLSGKKLDKNQQKEIERLKARDQEVKTHEQAHIAAGGNLVRGGASYEYQKGPDGKNYAVGGEVQLDTSIVKGNPEKTIAKMQQVKRAAMAPAEPSAQDRKVANQASQAEQKARTELNEEKSQVDNSNKNPYTQKIKEIYQNKSHNPNYINQLLY